MVGNGSSLCYGWSEHDRGAMSGGFLLKREVIADTYPAASRLGFAISMIIRLDQDEVKIRNLSLH
jgi:hypothetical protein